MPVYKFVPEMSLRQPGFTYSVCGPFNKKQILIQNELDKACFHRDIADEDFKDFVKRTAADKVLHDKAFNIAKNPKHDGYERDIALMVQKFFNKKTSGGTLKREIMPNQQLAEKLQKPIIGKFEKRKVY